MAAQLENAKIDHDDMKDLHESLTGHKWVDEKTVKICYKCERDFTIKRRKVNFHGVFYRWAHVGTILKDTLGRFPLCCSLADTL